MSVPRALLAEVDREEALGVDPAASHLWLLAPWSLRRNFSLGRLSAEDYWNQLRRWLK